MEEHPEPLHPANAEELANLAKEAGAEVLRATLRYPSESGGWQLDDLDLSEHLAKCPSRDLVVVIASMGKVDKEHVVCDICGFALNGVGECPRCVRRSKLSEGGVTSIRVKGGNPSFQRISSHCPHVKGCLTPATPAIRKEPGGMQATNVPLPRSLNLDMRKGKSRRVNASELPTKASLGTKRAMRLAPSDQKGEWVVVWGQRPYDDGTYSHRSIGRTRPGRSPTLGTTVSPMRSLRPSPGLVDRGLSETMPLIV